MSDLAPARFVTADETFDLLMQIPSVVVLYGNGRNFHADEHTHAGRLLRQLDDFARSGIAVRGMICERGALTRSSIRALNCYLRHVGSLSRFRGLAYPFGGLNKYGWQEFQRHVGLVWVA